MNLSINSSKIWTGFKYRKSSTNGKNYRKKTIANNVHDLAEDYRYKLKLILIFQAEAECLCIIPGL